MFVANLVSKYKQAKRDCRAARKLIHSPLQQTRNCENRSVFIDVASIEYSLVRNWQQVPWEISRSPLTFPWQNTHKFCKLFRISWSSIGNIYYDKHRCPRFVWTALQVVRTSFLGPRPRFYPPPGFQTSQFKKNTWVGSGGMRRRIEEWCNNSDSRIQAIDPVVNLWGILSQSLYGRVVL